MQVVMLYDMNGERRDKFATKPAESGVSSGLAHRCLLVQCSLYSPVPQLHTSL